MCASFTKANLVKIQQFEGSKFRKDFMARDPTMLMESPEVIFEEWPKPDTQMFFKKSDIR
jgi:hypothetical protein